VHQRRIGNVNRDKSEHKINQAADQGAGEDVAFLDRWGYDAEQRRVIATAVEAVAG
jgi:hypothetical protein